MLAATASLGRRAIEIHAAGTHRLSPGFFSRYVTRRLAYEPPRKNPDRFINWLLEQQRSFHYDMIMPVGDDEIEAIASNVDKLGGELNSVIPPCEAFLAGRDKALTIKTALDCGVPCPKTYFPADEALEDACGKVEFPALIKPNISAGARGIVRVNSAKELLCQYDKIKRQFGNCTIQELIPSGGKQHKADYLVDKNQNVIAGVVYHKMRYFPVSGGSSTLVRTVRHDEIDSAAKKMLTHLRWYGFCDFDFIEDPRDGVSKLMEINPRFPESLSMPIFAGVDLPYLIYRMALGEEIEKIESYQLGKYSRFLAGDIMWFLNSPERFSAEPSFFRLFSRDQTYYVESLKDPGPTIGYLLEGIAVTLSWERFKGRFIRGL